MTASASASASAALSPALRARAYGFVAAAFRSPGPGWEEEISAPELWRGWPEALAPDDPELAFALAEARDLLPGPGTAGEAAARYSAVFGHTLRGRCPSHELEFGRGEIFQKSAELADIAGFYSAFGLEMDGEGREREDHVSVECEFMMFLALKEAYASGRGDAEGVEIVRSAQRRFLEAHPGAWLPGFASRVEEAAENGFLAAAARFAALFIERECEAFGTNRGPRGMELRPTHLESETAIDCMTAENCGSCPLESLMPATFGAGDEERA